MTLVIGLTGGIGSGKSAAAMAFAAHGAPVCDADILTRSLSAPGTPALAALRAHFGNDILNQDGTLDRAALRARVFDNASERAALEAILHPAVHDAMIAWVAQQSAPYCLLVIPLLIETGYTDLVDRILVVDVDEPTQRTRAATRDGAQPEEIDKIIAAQITRNQRRAAADDILDNTGTLDTLNEQVTALHERYLQLAAEQDI